MDMNGLLERINHRAALLGVSDRDISLRAGGSADLIRNWRRDTAAKKTVGPRYDHLLRVAEVLQTPLPWLLGEVTGHLPPPTGFAEQVTGFADPSATPYTFPTFDVGTHDPEPVLKQVFGSTCRTPAAFTLPVALPAFHFAAGDLAIVDLARLPVAGELCLFTSGESDQTYAVRRYLPPYLAAGDTNDTRQTLRIDDPHITVRAAVIGCIRGAPKPQP